MCGDEGGVDAVERDCQTRSTAAHFEDRDEDARMRGGMSEGIAAIIAG